MALAPQIERQNRLWTFHGGIHVPDEKALSNQAAITAAPLPRELILPLQQSMGAAARALVQVGERVLKGQMIAEPVGLISATLHAPTSGTVTAIEHRPVLHPSMMTAPCIVLASDGDDTWAELPEPMAAHDLPEPRRVLERVRWAGIVGLGGATFPADVKLNPGPEQPIDTLILNGAECEPYITCDDRLMREQPLNILRGVHILQHVLGQPRALIGVEDNKPEAIAALRAALADLPTSAPIEIVEIPTLYPSGSEKQLIRVLTGREIPSGGRPSNVRVVCQNVGTAAAVAAAVLEGRPLISRVVTMTGRAIANPGNLHALIGTPLSELVAQCGGHSETPARLLCGGPMMGFELSGTDAGLAKQMNCLLSLAPSEAPAATPALACIRCGRCAEACPISLLPQQMYWHARARNFDDALKYNLFDCIECGCCARVCPSHIPLVHYYRHAKSELLARQRDKRKSELTKARTEAKQARLERQAAEKKARQAKQKAELEAKKRAAEQAKAAAEADAAKSAAEDTTSSATAAATSTADQD